MYLGTISGKGILTKEEFVEMVKAVNLEIKRKGAT